MDVNFRDGLLNSRYRFVSLLQTGTYSKVYKCIDVKTNRPYSIKAIPGEFEDIANNEINSLLKLSGNRNICQLIASFKVDCTSYLILEYCQGGDLFEYIKQTKLNSKQLYVIALQLYNAIKYAHSKGVYHRDLKPENILMVDGIHSVKLCDWGLATSQQFSDDFSIGTKNYMAPEILFGKNRVYNSKLFDYWCFGLTLITLLFSKIPINLVTEHVEQNFMNLFAIYPNLNYRGFAIFNNFLVKRDLDNFIGDLENNYRLGFKTDDEIARKSCKKEHKRADSLTSLNWFEY